MKKLNNLNIKIFADGADLESIKAFNKHDYIKGFTTNPSLMKKVGIKDYDHSIYIKTMAGEKSTTVKVLK